LDPAIGGRTVFNAEEVITLPMQPAACYFVSRLRMTLFNANVEAQVAMTGNALIGSLLVFCGFNTLASKIASFFIGLSFAAVSESFEQ